MVTLLISWICLPVLGGPAIGDALAYADPDAAGRWTIALWVLWAAGVGALVAPRTVTLTAARLVVPGGALVGCWAAISGEPGVADVAAATTGVAAVVLLLAPSVSARFVDGSSYGDEVRIPLRTPATLALGPAPLAVVLAIAAAAAGPMLLLAGAVGAGIVATAAGWPLAAALTRSLHRLHRRWLVFVPAGVVVHDHLALAEPVLVQRAQIRRFAAAAADAAEAPGVRDLTVGAWGLVVAIDLGEPLVIATAARRGETAEAEAVTGLLVAPLLPGAAIAEAAHRRIPTS
jgi:hypothetical protein